jgi:hypothetical protein
VVAVGDTIRLFVTRRSTAAGAEAPGGTTVWRSLDGGTATVSTVGLVRALSSGTARIVAENAGAVDTARVTVTAAALSSVRHFTVRQGGTSPGVAEEVNGRLRAGDDEGASHGPMYGAVRYDVGAIPTDATVTHATLDVGMTGAPAQVTGSPFTLGAPTISYAVPPRP